ncbi:hypothetical protein DM2_898 [Halorubrum sp. DM2]|uniref:hypothetical protein n=1 Tax=Halorubrum sp. DM2 TaxID=2527867 RepID=UPI0024B71A1B|nr:hypothetical protein [Halorubrum sp. DM2]VTT87564.1 hypothetical protein DM2_898 [Halorubrum sp. DM2]
MFEDERRRVQSAVDSERKEHSPDPEARESEEDVRHRDAAGSDAALGPELPDPEAEAAVDDAAARLADGDVDAADETLAAAFPSVCERETPAAVDRPTEGETERQTTGTVSCLRHGRAESAELTRSDESDETGR